MGISSLSKLPISQLKVKKKPVWLSHKVRQRYLHAANSHLRSLKIKKPCQLCQFSWVLFVKFCLPFNSTLYKTRQNLNHTKAEGALFVIFNVQEHVIFNMYYLTCNIYVQEAVCLMHSRKETSFLVLTLWIRKANQLVN